MTLSYMRICRLRIWLAEAIGTVVANLMAFTFVVGTGASILNGTAVLEDRIVGGTDTVIEDYPYQLSLEIFGSHACGASIISANRALTAAHCTDGQRASNLRIRAGSSVRGSGGQVIGVSSICQHPGYNAWSIDYDVSVLLLSHSIVFGSSAQSVILSPAGEKVPEGQLGAVSGWGATSEGGSLPLQLQVVHVPRVSDASCKSVYGSSKITYNMICFGYTKGGKDSCQGDSGGPLAINGVQVGVVSWGYGCARSYLPGVYAKVAVLRNHIDRC